MRIAYVTETYVPEINGVALTAARAVAYLRAKRHPLELIRPAQPGERQGAASGEWRSAGYPALLYPELRFGLARAATLAARFRSFGAELVHIATEGPLGWTAATAALRLGLPVTSDFRTNFDQYSRHYGLGAFEFAVRGYLRHFHNRTHRTFAPTQETRRQLDAAGFERVEVIGRGVDLQRFSPTLRSAALRAAWVGDEAGPVLLYVGRIAPEKNVELALQAFRAARAAVPATRMVVVGDGPRRAALARAYPEAIFVGRQTGAALAAHYASADVFVFPSLSETFGNVTMEALASGLPVVGFRTAAVAEHVQDGVNGRSVEPGDAAGFQRATVEIAAVSDRLPAFAAAARASVAAHDWANVLGCFETRLVETALDPASTGSPAACTA